MIHHFELTTFLITCSSSWEKQATHEIKRVLPGAACRTTFFPGNILVSTEIPRPEALAALEAAETGLIGRVVPLDLRCDISKHRTSLDELLEAARELPPLNPEFTFRVRCDRRGNHEFGSRDVELFVGDKLVDEWGTAADLEVPEQLVSIEIFQDLAFMSATWADEVLRKEISQFRKHATGQRPLNRAEKKLREAISKFKIRLPVGARALDLGAAPGGWTRVLAEYAAEVIAVDPAQLDERVLALPNVKHLTMRSEDYLARAEGPFDIVTCDMNVPSHVAAQRLCETAPLLTDQGQAVLTIKFGSRHRREHVQRALDVLEVCYEGFEIRHLPHNGKETTMWMRKRPRRQT